MSAKLTLLTTFAPGTPERIRAQHVAAHAFSLLDDCEVIVLDEGTSQLPLCNVYGFKHLTGMRTGKDVGVDTRAFCMDHAFSMAARVAQGDCIAFINGDCVMTSYKFADLASKLSVASHGQFACFGRRYDLPARYYFPILHEPVPDCMKQVVDMHRRGWTTRIPYGVDVYLWSRAVFSQVRPIPILIDGWYYDNWLVNDMWLNAGKSLWSLNGLVDVVHMCHDDTNTRQTTTAKPSTEHNHAALLAGMLRVDVYKMDTPPTVPEEYLL